MMAVIFRFVVENSAEELSAARAFQKYSPCRFARAALLVSRRTETVAPGTASPAARISEGTSRSV